MQDDRKVCACPLCRELCVNGITASSPKDANGFQVVCRWWIHVVGNNPQTGKEMDLFDCSIAWLPTMSLENAQMVRQNTASIDKTANTFFKALSPDVQERIMLQGTDDTKLLDNK